MPIGVTGSSGNLGGRITRLLASEGVEQRLLLRTPTKAPALPRTEVAQASYDDGAAVRRGLTGVEVALMVSGSESVNRLDEHRSFVDAAAEAGVRHLVYTSFYGAAADSTFTLARDHHHTERYIERSGMTWTFLRDNLYLDFFPMLAGDDGVIRGPADGGRVSAVAQDDIAAVATAVLLDPSSHERRTYDLTGPESLTLAEAAATMTRLLGRQYTFHDESLDDAYASRSSYGAPNWQVEAWVSTYTAIASGEVSGVTDDVERVTGRAPLSLADVLADRA
jgi:NAD(P)H dehydrogenase (quinone)